LVPMLDPDNKATAALWLADVMNSRKLMFSEHLDLDGEAIANYEPPVQEKEPEVKPEAYNDSRGRRLYLDAEFNEADHPRASNGEFGSGSTPKRKSYEEHMQSKSESDRSSFSAAKQDGIAIPPAWTNVTYHGKAGENGVIARGTDAKGRHQIIEDAAYRDSKIKEKHERIQKNLGPQFDKMTASLKTKAASGNEEAKVLYLIAKTSFRIGGEGDGKAAHAAFGASTLQGEHVKVSGDMVEFNFPGKHGVQQHHVIQDSVIADYVKDAKPGEPIFKTSDSKVRAAWKKEGGEKVHDIRSLIATKLASEVVHTVIPPKPKTDKDKKAVMEKAAQVAAKVLGNDPKESLKTYIDHSVFQEMAA